MWPWIAAIAIIAAVVFFVRRLKGRFRAEALGLNRDALAGRLKYPLVAAPKKENFDFKPRGFEVLREERPEQPREGSTVRIRPYYLLANGKVFCQLQVVWGLGDDFMFLESIRRMLGKSIEISLTGEQTPEGIQWARLFFPEDRNTYVYAAKLDGDRYLWRSLSIESDDPAIGSVIPYLDEALQQLD